MRLALLACLTVLALAGCTGGDDSDDERRAESAPAGSAEPSSSPTPEGPDCADIWKTGETLPEDFDTCVLDGRVPDFDVTECTDGTRLIVADNIRYARTGGEIKQPEEAPLQDTEEYGQEYADCTGE